MRLPWPGAARPSVGAALVRSEMFAEFKAQLGGGTPPRTGVVEVELQGAALLPPAGGYPAETAAPPLPLPVPAWGTRTISDLFTVIPASGGSVAYLRDPVGATAADLDRQRTTGGPSLGPPNSFCW